MAKRAAVISSRESHVMSNGPRPLNTPSVGVVNIKMAAPSQCIGKVLMSSELHIILLLFLFFFISS